MIKKIIISIILMGIILFGLIQLVPYGHNHINPAIVSEPKWDSPQTKELAKRACLNCHSNETVWPWYSNVAPVSWLVLNDVEKGREYLNFSDWENFSVGYTGLARVIENGKMPPLKYFPTHPEARLTSSEKAQLLDGLKNTLSK